MMNCTPYPLVNDLLQRFLVAVHGALGDQFTGLYLYGSLAVGDFNPPKSDIDFVVVTEGELNECYLEALREVHTCLADEPLEMEGSYISRQALWRYEPGNAYHPHIDRSSPGLQVERHDTDWIIQRFILRNYGVTVVGPDIRTLIDAIAPDELRQAVLDLMWWWELQLHDNHRVAHSDYQAYAILSMCRILYTLEHGDVLSKPAAARWGQKYLEPQWAELIKRGLSWQPGQTLDSLPETLDFIRFTLKQCEKFKQAHVA